ncbi:hypothetical protein PRK78_006854 [Emydomyces testavorans]|uniref:non-specific serine/threonine protein kinase n=1 Tax=Emydomyces testavorans TaxID=2070801 RepID=A0AAF0IPH2_9EURO|nr:hypothetical protein PRK78_006854 [Emydomyces testavorans]
MKRKFFSARVKPVQLRRATSPIPQDQLIDEEACPAYNSKNYYPAEPGEVLANRYQMLVKIGWGTRSTVWLARDMTRYSAPLQGSPQFQASNRRLYRYRWQSERFMALKINNCNLQEANRERDIEEYIAKQNPSHRGHEIIRSFSESFEVAGPEGSHLCLAYEPMREPMWLFQRRFKAQRLPLGIVKAYLLVLLAGLDYLHSECKVVHTGKCSSPVNILDGLSIRLILADLKLENILVTFEDQSVIKDFVESQGNMPMQHKTDSTGRTIYRCHNDFGPLRRIKNLPKIADFGLASRFNSQEDFGIHPIQPDHYRAPEVILGCGWTASADIWNLGVLVWDIVERTELFSQVHDAQGRYDSKAHLAEMIALLGSPPKELLAKSNAMLQCEWPYRATNEEGKLCKNTQEYFGGPFFDQEGKFLHDDLIPDRKLRNTFPSLEEKEREACLSFVSKMITWLPEERKTARELMEHPFLDLSRRVDD